MEMSDDDGTSDNSMGVANGRLIAAAPDLLAALREADAAVNCALAMAEQGVAPPDWDWLREVRERARAAIAKAEGRS
jgi:hypothetical protein